MIKTLICNVPPLDSERPSLSAGILAATCQKLNHSIVLVDLNLELKDFIHNNMLSNDLFDNVFWGGYSQFNHDQESVIKLFLNYVVDKIKFNEYDYIIVSLFSFLAQPFASIFLEYLRSRTDAKIIIGGAGITKSIDISFTKSFGQHLKDKKIVDEYIVGEAEESLIQYFQQGHGPGIGNKNFVQLSNLDQYPFPNYDYHNLQRYKNSQGELEFVIVGSRGCVLNCTFCDVANTSPKYRFRSGQNIAQEIIFHYEKYGVTNFYFADSLVNGSFKAFDDMCNALVRYKFNKPISWSGQYLIRPKSNTPKDHFKMMREAGGRTLYAGIESGSDRVRAEIGKKFTNDDIEFYLENFLENKIEILFLFFSGYVSETIEDYQETLQMFPRWQKYVASGTIIGIETLNLLGILSGSPLEHIAINEKFMFMNDSESGAINTQFWLNPNNPKFDFLERAQRHVTMIEEAMKYKWPLWNSLLSLNVLEKHIVQFKNSKNKYIILNKF